MKGFRTPRFIGLEKKKSKIPKENQENKGYKVFQVLAGIDLTGPR